MTGTEKTISRPRVIVVGSGFAGVAVARALRGADAELVLVDRQNHDPSPPKPLTPARRGSNFLSVAHGPSGHP